MELTKEMRKSILEKLSTCYQELANNRHMRDAMNKQEEKLKSEGLTEKEELDYKKAFQKEDHQLWVDEVFINGKIKTLETALIENDI